jgi:hypothetical protein
MEKAWRKHEESINKELRKHGERMEKVIKSKLYIINESDTKKSKVV